MQHHNKRVLYLSFIFIILLLSGLYYYRLINIELSSAKIIYKPSLRLFKVQAKEYDEQGKLVRKLNSPIVEYNFTQKNSLIHKPLIQLIKNGKPWFIKADKALSPNQQKVILKGHVSLTQYQKGKVISQLTTSKLIYYPKSQTIQTPAQVFYQNQNLTVQSKGLFADLNNEIIELKSQTRGIYAPKVA